MPRLNITVHCHGSWITLLYIQHILTQGFKSACIFLAFVQIYECLPHNCVLVRVEKPSKGHLVHYGTS